MLRAAELLLWPVAAAAPAALALALARPPVSPPPLTARQSPATHARRSAAVSADSLVAAVVARDVFRLDRRPAPEQYQDDLGGAAQAAAPEMVRPALVLVGIVGGAEPTAVVEGFPGAEGARVVHAGERVGELLVKRIRGGTVEISGMDTLWVLRVREPWNERP